MAIWCIIAIDGMLYHSRRKNIKYWWTRVWTVQLAVHWYYLSTLTHPVYDQFYCLWDNLWPWYWSHCGLLHLGQYKFTYWLITSLVSTNLLSVGNPWRNFSEIWVKYEIVLQTKLMCKWCLQNEQTSVRLESKYANGVYKMVAILLMWLLWHVMISLLAIFGNVKTIFWLNCFKSQPQSTDFRAAFWFANISGSPITI